MTSIDMLRIGIAAALLAVLPGGCEGTTDAPDPNPSAERQGSLRSTAVVADLDAVTPAAVTKDTAARIAINDRESLPVAVATGPTAGRYFVYDVGRLDDVPIGPIRLNGSGAVTWNAFGRAYVYQNCRSVDLGNLGGGQSVANAIIDNGTVVGRSMAADGRWRAFSYANGVIRDLGGSSGEYVWEEAIATNFWGDVVGVESALGTLGRTGVRYQAGVAVPLANALLPNVGLTPVTDIVDMNDSGYIVGFDHQSGTALLSTNSGHLWGTIQGVPGLEFSTIPRAMNRYGHVAGVAGQFFPVHAFISRDSTSPATDLGTLDAAGEGVTVANGINDYDWVVGGALDPNILPPQAFLHDGTQMINLNTDLWNPGGWGLREATAVNDAGQIVGTGSLNGETHAFLLQPMTQLQSIRQRIGCQLQLSRVETAFTLN